MTREDVKELKKALSKTFPNAKSTHLYEAIAVGFGCATYAGLLAAIAGTSARKTQLPDALDAAKFEQRLLQLEKTLPHQPTNEGEKP